MSDRVTLECVGSYLIPVGHRVEVRMFAEPVVALFGSGRRESRPEAPWIADLDTGVVYGHGWHYRVMSSLGAWGPVALGVELRGDLDEIWRVVGVVEASRHLWLTVGSLSFPQTTLVLRPA